MTVPAAIKAEVERRLDEIEILHGVRVLYACESGSRAWGFDSRDSDYDVRFLYIHPRSFYLSIDLGEKSDVIEPTIDGPWDLSGWDLHKALRLFRKSNPPLMEWLQSPIIYRSSPLIVDRLRELLKSFYSPIAARYHYLHMAQGNFRDYLKGEIVWRKKYLYVLRPLLACRWLERDLGPVPMEFDSLIERADLESDVHQAVEALLALKRAGNELDRGPRVDVLSLFIERELARQESLNTPRQATSADVATLNELFLEAVEELSGEMETE